MFKYLVFMKYAILFICCIGIFLSCNQDRAIPDVSNINAPVHVYRFDRDLFLIDTTHIFSEIKVLKKDYPAFFPLYFHKVLPILTDTSLVKADALKILDFITDERIRTLYNETQERFKDFTTWKKQLHFLNKYIKYYYPDEIPPNYYTFISEYAFAAFIFNDTSDYDGIGIGLDMFLGSDYDYRKKNPYDNSFSDYLNRNYTPDFIIKRVAEVWIADNIPPPRENRLLDKLLYEGKKIYILKKLIPTIQDTVLFGYKPSQLEWVKENEHNIWAHLIAQDLIYTHDYTKIVRMLEPSPHTVGMPPEAPGQAVLYCGYQIINNYMNLHPETSLKELSGLNDAQKILSNSRYKPS